MPTNNKIIAGQHALAAFISKLPEAIIICDTKGIVMLHDDQAVGLLNENFNHASPGRNLKNKSITQFIDKQLIEHSLDELNEQLKENLGNPSSGFLLQRSGKVLEVLIVPILGDLDEFQGFVTIIKDITKQTRAERKIESFLKTLSKNARSPMASIRAAIEAMRAFPGMELKKQMQFKEIIYNEAIVLSDLLDRAQEEYTSLTRIQKALKPVRVIEFIKTFKRRYGDTFELRLDKKDSEKAEAPFIMADMYRLMTAVCHVLSNLNAHTGESAFFVSWMKDQKIIQIDISWAGKPVGPRTVKEWEQEHVDYHQEGVRFTLLDILNQHQIVVLTDRYDGKNSNRAYLRLFIPEADQELSGKIESDPIIPESRVEFDDIEQFAVNDYSRDLDNRLLTELSYTALIRKINSAGSLEEIIGKHSQLPRLIHAMLTGGMKIRTVTWLVTAFSDAILNKLMAFAMDELGSAPVPFAFVTLGSEGRMEQTLKTDQDNAIIFQDPGKNQSKEALQAYFLKLGDKVCTWLDQAGFDFCQGGIMAKNPKWCQPLSVWKSYFSSWIHAPSPETLLHTSIFFDFRFAYGNEQITLDLLNTLETTLSGWTGFFRNMAENAVYFTPPIGFLGRFLTESKGPYKNCLDIKMANLPIIDFARIYALKHGVRETSTQDRLYQLYLKKVLNRADYNVMEQAYSFNMQIRFMGQISSLLKQNMKPTNYINPKELSSIERKMLKEVLLSIKNIQSRIRLDFIGAAEQSLG